MKIKSITLENFTVFREKQKIEFCDGINVLIGANGTGKSHLLKLIYSMMKANENGGSKSELEALSYENQLAVKLAKVFKPDEDGINRLISRNVGNGTARVTMATSGGEIGFELTGKNTLKKVRNKVAAGQQSIFLPSREALAMYEGFVASYEKRELSFDETYADLCVALSASQILGAREAFLKSLVEPLEKVIGGKIKLQGNRFYHVAKDSGKLEAHLMSEGLRKIGSLIQLLTNGSLTEQGFLFWDEPEANLNPKMVRTVVELLSKLAGHKIQVFVATHDYLLTNELSLMAEYREQMPADAKLPIRFFCLSRDSSRGVLVESADALPQLASNPILDEFAAHYDRENDILVKS